MKLKLLKINHELFGENKPNVLAYDHTKLSVFPNVGDVLHYAGARYKVVQKDIHIEDDLSDETVTLFLSIIDIDLQ